MSTTKREAAIDFECTNEVCDSMPTWTVEGRWNAEGKFEPNDPDLMKCPECEEPAEPEDMEIEVADL